MCDKSISQQNDYTYSQMSCWKPSRHCFQRYSVHVHVRVCDIMEVGLPLVLFQWRAPLVWAIHWWSGCLSVWLVSLVLWTQSFLHYKPHVNKRVVSAYSTVCVRFSLFQPNRNTAELLKRLWTYKLFCRGYVFGCAVSPLGMKNCEPSRLNQLHTYMYTSHTQPWWSVIN